MVFACLLACLPPSARAQGRDPAAAYRAAVDAFSRGDANAYFRAFAPELRCFYESRSVPLARVRALRERYVAENRARRGAHPLVIEQLDLVRRTADAAVLRDQGRFGNDGHDKLVLMLRQNGAWRIAAEGGPRSLCYAELARSETITGIDPLASEEGIRRALRAADGAWGYDPAVADLVDLASGVVGVTVRPGKRPVIGCDTPVISFPDGSEGAALRCDRALGRCVLGDTVYRFGVRGGRRQLLGIVEYVGRPVPARESREVERALSQRDRLCELHDRVLRADPTLATDDLWVLEPDDDGDLSTRHLCGSEAVQRGREAIEGLGASPLSCTEVRCAMADPGTVDPALYARRDENGALRLWVAADLVAGTDVPRHVWRRLEARCGR